MKNLCVMFLLFLLCLEEIESWVDFFTSREEGKKILGLNAEVWYIENGTLNDYALGFSVMVPDSVWKLYFSWKSLKQVPVPYSMDIQVSHPGAMKIPQISVILKGRVPVRPGRFRMVLACTGKFDALVEIFLKIKFFMGAPFSESTELVVKRKKICQSRNETSTVAPLTADAMITTPDSFFITISCTSLVILLLLILTIVCYLKSARKRSFNVCRYDDNAPVIRHSPHREVFRAASFNNSSRNSYASVKKMTSSVNSAIVCDQVKSYQSLNVPRKISKHISEVKMKRKHVILCEKVQEGTYGQIYNAILRKNDKSIYHSMPVFVKTVKDQTNSIQASLMIKDGMMMLGLKNKYILPLMGLCTDDYPHPILVYPPVLSNLKLFLRDCWSGHGYVLTTVDLLSMAIQILKATEYLHGMGIIHKDIATRNCVVDEQFRVKLSDNALARDLFPGDYHCLCDSENRPIKWLAIESIARNEFSKTSDVWSYGVTMWELITVGHQPYSLVDSFEMYTTLMDGYRLSQPKNCPDDLYKLMWYCWAEHPEVRPTINELLTNLQILYIKLESFI